MIADDSTVAELNIFEWQRLAIPVDSTSRRNVKDDVVPRFSAKP